MPPSPDDLRAFCRRALEDPERGLSDLERIARSADMDRLFPLLDSQLPDLPDPDLALIHLERWCREEPPPADLDAFHALLVLSGYSPYLAESILADRGALAELTRARARTGWDAARYRDELARWLRIFSQEDPWEALRRFKRRINLRIGLMDLQRRAGFADICREISAAADALVGCALEIVTNEELAQSGRPMTWNAAGRLVPAEMVVVALGKLGGNELNYSSDIDLLFVYSDDGETTGLPGRPETQITNKEHFTRIAESLSRGLGQISREGQVFRVDCQLRPGGRDGDLVVPLQGALAYYRTWARAWERQALIKARPCAGDLVLGESFLEALQSVVYADAPDAGLADAIREMKDRIDADLARRGRSLTHLKLGRGGIREIEFVAQALQMHSGGRDPWLREPNTMLALHRLADRGLLSVVEQGALSAAYVYLRDVEHRIQIHRNLQRSTLPAAERDLRILARAVGARDAAHRQEAQVLQAALDQHREAVRSIYDAVLGRLSQAPLSEEPAPDPFLDPMPEPAVVQSLAAAGVGEAADLLGSIKSIARLLVPHAARPEVARLFRRLTPVLLKALAESGNPVRALRTLERYLASLGLSPDHLVGLLHRPDLIPPLLALFGGSQPLASILISQPGLVLEEGFGAAITRERSAREHLIRLRERLAGCQAPGEVSATLRAYHRVQLLYIGLADLSRKAGPAQVCRAQSDLAEACVQAALECCARQLGWPLERTGEVKGFAVMGLGRLGYRELDYGSDLDLVFVYDPGEEDPATRHARAGDLARALLEMLTAITRDGPLYAVDGRLRPYGTDGDLAQPASRLMAYLRETAAVWELQSWLKARPVAGDPDLRDMLHERIEPALFDAAGRSALEPAVGEMKARLERESRDRAPGAIDIKLGAGGLNAIQFAIQYLQLRHAIRSPSLKRTTRVLATLRAAGVLDEETHRTLHTGFHFLRRLEHQLRLIHGRPLSRLPGSPETMDEIARALDYAGPRPGEGLLHDLGEVRRRIEAAWSRVIGDSGASPAGADRSVVPA